ncbi:hypothetical protein ACTEYT_08245 [Limosilactobacillus reuteri]|jgi:hypothetical protein|uniref:Regulatory protein, TetR n=3 Tax=Limosilactobacillus reuteri TaxID=1598 RepID=A0A0U5JFP3_LIMRT|nr:hypothetical protein [Limosilactobacillus reuteri]CCC03789.1 hypothetical protein LRATCC53608_1038 [Limosilactobacillus reuteri subsp. suis]AGN98294.1 transcriptional regulator, TetR family [Limosilactobacillus reuteri I5007]AMY14127.1 hypothetical protein ADV92_06135 [Limosilactobacillus reuteri]MCC4339225.1 hypothetical protein [Limosilactobacillus reuteri]MCC4350440.1 hypothetical protein [Limosilactobacillus reuteri]
MDIRKINTLNGIKEGFITVLDTKKLSECTTNDIVNSAEISKKLSTTITKINKIFSMKLKMIYWKV